MGPSIVLEWLETAEWSTIASVARSSRGTRCGARAGVSTAPGPTMGIRKIPIRRAPPARPPRIRLAARGPRIRRSSGCPPSAWPVAGSSDQLPIETSYTFSRLPSSAPPKDQRTPSPAAPRIADEERERHGSCPPRMLAHARFTANELVRPPPNVFRTARRASDSNNHPF